MRHFVLGDGEFVALAGADHELALATVGDLAGDGIVEEAMLEPFDDKPFEAIERVADLSAWALKRGFGLASAIVQQRLHVFDGRGEGERPDADGVAVEREHVFTPRRPVLKNKDLPPALGAQVKQVVARAAKEAGEVEVASLDTRRDCSPLLPAHLCLSS